MTRKAVTDFILALIVLAVASGVALAVSTGSAAAGVVTSVLVGLGLSYFGIVIVVSLKVRLLQLVLKLCWTSPRGLSFIGAIGLLTLLYNALVIVPGLAIYAHISAVSAICTREAPTVGEALRITWKLIAEGAVPVQYGQHLITLVPATFSVLFAVISVLRRRFGDGRFGEDLRKTQSGVDKETPS